MSTKTLLANEAFDEYADDYDHALAQGLNASGESKEYFAHGRVSWLARRLRELGGQPKSVLDFGCGTGAATPFLRDILKVDSIIGVDTSAKSLEVARRQHGSPDIRFHPLKELHPDNEFDLAFCNGVFHHIPPHERDAAIDYIFKSLRSGGWFAFWENNPWNPGTRYIMKRIPFDHDAITLTPPEAVKLLRKGGFEVVRKDFLFIFPNALRHLRGIEPLVCGLPLGGQYQALCRKP